MFDTVHTAYTTIVQVEIVVPAFYFLGYLFITLIC